LVGCFQADEDWGDDADWITGIIHATKAEIMQKSAVGGRGFGGFQKAWDQLMQSSLVEEQPDKSLVLPFFKKKAYDAISPREIRERFYRLEDLHRSDLRAREGEPGEFPPPRGEVSAQTVGKPSEKTPRRGENGENTKKREKPPLRGEKPPLRGDFSPLRGVENSEDILLKGLKKEKKISLSSRNVISGFYRGIGQKRISREKRERANGIFKKLRKDGFSAEDIAFAVEWTLENAKEEPYDFAIIQHTIGQAIAAKEKEEAEAKEIEERERKAAEEKDLKEREEKEREEIENRKESLSPEERAELHERAEAEIRESGDFKPQFITEFLIEIKENEILRRDLEKQNNAVEENND